MAKRNKQKKEKLGEGKSKKIDPSLQKFYDALTLAKSRNDTIQVRNLEKIIKRLGG